MIAWIRPCLVAALVGAVGCNDGPDPLIGVYTLAPEVNTFRPCGGERTYWVVGSDEILQTLRAAHDRLAAGPSAGIFVQVFTRHSGRPQEGFARRYDANLGITEVLQVSADIPTSCLDTSWTLPGRRPTYF